ncbi:hypothetical protein KUV51_10925 [Tateyamaria omphalii]|uniref:hypothetical protein n=1 Tax=Tateyamaria omphalii TaxID=299262 RepID=UPI001C993BE1|nr:hypothetical protein [Tateyamaria omphalii]MBY5933514.1 hypothetical protein [Tateyamaria omphalii]
MTMSTEHPNVPALKATLDALINAVSGHAFDVLDRTYHRDMQTYLLIDGDTLMQNDKPGFMNHVQEAMGQMKDHDPWAEYHLVEADEANGHILISRRNNVTNRKQLVTLSIDFVFEDGRWQITREVIMTRGEETRTHSRTET